MTLLTARQIGIISGHQRSGYYVDAQNMMIVFMFFFLYWEEHDDDDEDCPSCDWAGESYRDCLEDNECTNICFCVLFCHHFDRPFPRKCISYGSTHLVLLCSNTSRDDLYRIIIFLWADLFKKKTEILRYRLWSWRRQDDRLWLCLGMLRWLSHHVRMRDGRRMHGL